LHSLEITYLYDATRFPRQITLS